MPSPCKSINGPAAPGATLSRYAIDAPPGNARVTRGPYFAGTGRAIEINRRSIESMRSFVALCCHPDGRVGRSV